LHLGDFKVAGVKTAFPFNGLGFVKVFLAVRA
jgi:hypothetical protein